jgi:hypothetical protein
MNSTNIISVFLAERTQTLAAAARAAALFAITSSAIHAYAQSCPVTEAPQCGGSIRCVGVGKTYGTIQAAVTAAQPGDTVLVDDGKYVGFTVSRSGTPTARITIRAAGSNAVITSGNQSRNEGITISNASYVTVTGFTIVGMPERGLAAHDATGDAPMRGLQILNNIVRDSASDNIYLSQVADSLAEGNSSSGSKAEHGMYLTNAGSDNTTLRGNRLFNNAKDGLHMNGDIRYGGDGIHKNVVIDGNIIYGNAVNAMDLDGVQDTTIQNNLVYDNGRNGVRVFQIDASAGPKNLRIINNTIVMRSGGGWAIKLTEDAGGHVIFNNVLLAEGATGSIAVGNTNFVSENNATSNTFSLDGDKTNISLQAWKAAGHDATSFSTTSVATFVGGGDYRPKAGALVINAGRAALSSITAPTKDIIGAARPAGVGVDIGAYESAGN